MNRSENDIKLLILLKCSAIELCMESSVSYSGNEKHRESPIRPFLCMLRTICDENIMPRCGETMTYSLKITQTLLRGWMFGYLFSDALFTFGASVKKLETFQESTKRKKVRENLKFITPRCICLLMCSCSGFPHSHLYAPEHAGHSG